LGLSVVTLLVTAGLGAVGVGAFVAGGVTRRKRKELEGDGGADGLVPTVLHIDPDALAKFAKGADEAAMRRNPVAYTSFFTRDVEREVVSRLEDWRAIHGTSKCTPEVRYLPSPLGGMHQMKYLAAAATATDALLQQLYPAGRPWRADEIDAVATAAEAEASVGLWRWWLWRRVYRLAQWHVCGYEPVT